MALPLGKVARYDITIYHRMALCEVALSDSSDLLAEEMKFVLGWNSTSTTGFRYASGPVHHQAILNINNLPHSYFVKQIDNC